MVAFQKALLEQFDEFRARNSAYSLRAYARRLQVNSGVLSAVMGGRRKVSRTWVERLVKRMALPPEKVRTIQDDLIMNEMAHPRRTEDEAEFLLRSDEFHLISEGLHYALLALLQTHDCNGEVEWMGARLNSSPRKVRSALERLERLNMVTADGNGRWSRLKKARVRTSEGISNIAIKRYHEERLEEAKSSLFQVDVNDRDFLSSTVAINKSKLPIARKLVRDFMIRLEKVLGEDCKDEVYRIGIQIFPVTGASRGRNE